MKARRAGRSMGKMEGEVGEVMDFEGAGEKGDKSRVG